MYIMLSHISDADLARLEVMLSEAEKNGGWSSRLEIVDRDLYDTKAAYHVVRLLGEIEMILVEHDLDLERNREQLKAIRRGEWTLVQLETYFSEKERALEQTYANSTLQHSPDEKVIKNILMNALEMFYGSLQTAVTRSPDLAQVLLEMQSVIDKFR